MTRNRTCCRWCRGPLPTDRKVACRELLCLERRKPKNRKRYLRHKEKELERSKTLYKDPEYAAKRSAYFKETRANWTREQRDKYNKQKYEYFKRPENRAAASVRSRVNQLVKKSSSETIHSKTIGCSNHELKAWLESHFLVGMSWENYGSWHIDHKVPLSVAIKMGPEAFSKACHYTNLQPMWAKDNLIKGNRINERGI